MEETICERWGWRVVHPLQSANPLLRREETVAVNGRVSALRRKLLVLHLRLVLCRLCRSQAITSCDLATTPVDTELRRWHWIPSLALLIIQGTAYVAAYDKALETAVVINHSSSHDTQHRELRRLRHTIEELNILGVLGQNHVAMVHAIGNNEFEPILAIGIFVAYKFALQKHHARIEVTMSARLVDSKHVRACWACTTLK
jgi:hypothetical protein